MSTVLDVLYRARGFVLGTRRDAVTTSTVDQTISAATLTATSTLGAGAGAVIEIGREQMLVTSATSTVFTVIRGYAGTQPTAHKSGSIVVLNPQAPMQTLLDSANAELSSLSSPENGLFRVATQDISTNVGKIGFDLGVDDPNAFIDVLAVRYRQSNLGDWVRVKGYEVMRGMPTTDFASQTAILFPQGLMGTLTTRVWYSTAFGLLSDLSEDVPAVSGLPATAEDILAMGAAIRTFEGREMARANLASQPDPRRAAEVPMGNAMQATSTLRRSRDQRIAEEAARLKRQWGRM